MSLVFIRCSSSLPEDVNCWPDHFRQILCFRGRLFFKRIKCCSFTKVSPCVFSKLLKSAPSGHLEEYLVMTGTFMFLQHTAAYGFCWSSRDFCPSMLMYTSISPFKSAFYGPGTGDGKWMRCGPYSQGVPNLADVIRPVAQFSLEKS